MKNFIFTGIVIITYACNSHNESKEAINYSVSNDTIYINDKSTFREKIRMDTINIQSYKNKLSISGIVRAIPNNYAEIASPFSGRITRSFVRLGQYVKKDSPVFEISSPSFFDAGRSFYQAKQEMELAGKNLKRQNDLLSNGVGIQKDVEEAEVAYELTRRDYENSIASLSVYHVSPEELVLGQPLIVRSPIEGEIIDNKIVLGQYLKEDAEPVAIVSELSKVWVAAQLKEKDIYSVHESDEVEISLTGLPEIHLKGVVYHISEILDDETRSVQVFIECDNKDRMLKPGMYVTAQFSYDTENSILVPSNSVFQMEGSCFVFLKTGMNEFMRHKVEIAGTDNEKTFIRSGLKPGDIVINQGGSLLLEVR